jgi:hypothetical protein
MDEDEIKVGPDRRREHTDTVFRAMMEREASERRAKSERLRQARLLASKDDE